jgi:hypothetical protein
LKLQGLPRDDAEILFFKNLGTTTTATGEASVSATTATTAATNYEGVQ